MGAQKLRMNRRYAVGAMGADDRKMCHADFALWRVIDQAHAAQPRIVTRIEAANIIEKSTIDLVDDLQMPGDEQLEQLNWPALQGLGKQCVVGVSQRAQRQVPGLSPRKMGFVRRIRINSATDKAG